MNQKLATQMSPSTLKHFALGGSALLALGSLMMMAPSLRGLLVFGLPAIIGYFLRSSSEGTVYQSHFAYLTKSVIAVMAMLVPLEIFMYITHLHILGILIPVFMLPRAYKSATKAMSGQPIDNSNKILP